MSLLISNNLNKKLNEEIKKSNYSFQINIINYNLNEFPLKLFSFSLNLSNIIKLNLSFNFISFIPSEISLLINLKELYLNYNLISTLPLTISDCLKLEILNLNNTNLISLPSEICNLNKLYILSYKDTPFYNLIKNKYNLKENEINDINSLILLKKNFNDLYERKCLKNLIIEKLLSELYMKESDNPNTLIIIQNMVEVISSF